MHDPLDDVEITAYALGALDDAERSRVEALIAGSEDARRQVEDVRAAAADLREAFASVPRHTLTLAQRDAIEAAAAGTPTVPAPARRRLGAPLNLATVLAAAAVIVVAVAVPGLWRTDIKSVPDGVKVLLPSTAAPTAPGQQPSKKRPPAAKETLEQLRALGYIGRDTDMYAFEQSRAQPPSFITEAYGHLPENPFVLVAQDPRSTFSVDVDTASYANVRRFLREGELPPKDAVRIEELINYFPYAYAPPSDGRPFAVHMDSAACPWKPGHRLVRVAIKGREIPRGGRPPANLVFLLDVSGSMNDSRKLPLVKAAMRLLVGELGPADRVAIVVYAGSEGLALPSISASDKTAILSAIESLSPEGSTHGSAGIGLAYETAAANFIQGGINRVILATDGDFNVGVTSEGALVRLIEEKAKTGVFLTALGFGMGNLKDSTLEKLADHGNGNYAYIDGLAEARKVLVEQVGGTLVTIAKDVKLQVEFNPRRAQAFRLIGYENRVLAHQDFNDDTRDAGDVGAGHTVTALYEVVPLGADVSIPAVDPLKYQRPSRPLSGADAGELLTLKLRYKQPDGDESALMEIPLKDAGQAFRAASPEFQFAASVAAFGMILRDSPHKGDADFAKVLAWAEASLGGDKDGHRREFLQLVEQARSLQGQ